MRYYISNRLLIETPATNTAFKRSITFMSVFISAFVILYEIVKRFSNRLGGVSYITFCFPRVPFPTNLALMPFKVCKIA